VAPVNEVTVARLAALVRETYSDESLDTGVAEPTVVEAADGSRALVLPREEMPEPLRSLHVVDAAALGCTLVVTFTWGTSADVFVMPFDARGLRLDPDDDIAARTFVTQLVEHTLGGARETWEPRAIPISEGMAVVRPRVGGR
jgi:hypothetical protein